MSLHDARLQLLIDAWPSLSGDIKAQVEALCLQPVSRNDA
jgi:hypothetical protein